MDLEKDPSGKIKIFPGDYRVRELHNAIHKLCYSSDNDGLTTAAIIGVLEVIKFNLINNS